MPQGFLFPSKEWAEEFCRKLNENQDYRNAAKTWEGSIMFLATNLPPRVAEKYGRDRAGFVLDLFHGECRGSQWAEDPDKAEADYILEATYEDWKRVISGQLGPIPALMSRKLKVKKGSLATLIRYSAAALAMVKTAQTVPSIFG